LRMRVSMSAIGSVILILLRCPRYQLALVTPGISPARARRRKQMRHSVNRRMNALGRPHSRQRLCPWTLKRGGRCALAIIDFFAKFLASCVRFSPAGLPFSTVPPSAAVYMNGSTVYRLQSTVTAGKTDGRRWSVDGRRLNGGVSGRRLRPARRRPWGRLRAGRAYPAAPVGGAPPGRYARW
jgi:hypothetical protein